MSRILKYQKGTFLVIPNKGSLAGMRPNDQVVYFWICSFADDQGTCFPSRNKLSEVTGMSSRAVFSSIEALEEKGLLKKNIRKAPKDEYLSNEYQILIKEEGGYAPGAQGVMQEVHKGYAPRARGVMHHVPTNSIHRELNPINSIGAPRKVQKLTHDSLVPEVIKAFEEVDPKNKTYYGNTTQRKASDFLIEEYGLEQVLRVVKLLPKTNKQAYYPSINSPNDLKEKWTKLESALVKEKQKLSTTGRGIA